MSESGKWLWTTRGSDSPTQLLDTSGFSTNRGSLRLESARNFRTKRARPRTETWPTKQFKVWLDTSNLPIPPPVHRGTLPPPPAGRKDVRKPKEMSATKADASYRTLKRQTETKLEKDRSSTGWHQQERAANSDPRGAGTPSRMGRHSLFSYANTHPQMAGSERVSPWVTANTTQKMMLLRTVVRNPWMIQQASLYENKHVPSNRSARHQESLNWRKLAQPASPNYRSDVITPPPPPCLNDSFVVCKLH